MHWYEGVSYLYSNSTFPNYYNLSLDFWWAKFLLFFLKIILILDILSPVFLQVNFRMSLSNTMNTLKYWAWEPGTIGSLL
jgi:hypothetical protein